MISPRNVNLFTQLPCTTWIPITLMCTWISAFCNNYGSYLIMIWPASFPPKHTFPHVQPRKSSLKDQCCVGRLYITVLMSTTRFTIVEFSVDPTYLIFFLITMLSNWPSVFSLKPRSGSHDHKQVFCHKIRHLSDEPFNHIHQLSTTIQDWSHFLLENKWSTLLTWLQWFHKCCFHACLLNIFFQFTGMRNNIISKYFISHAAKSGTCWLVQQIIHSMFNLPSPTLECRGILVLFSLFSSTLESKDTL